MRLNKQFQPTRLLLYSIDRIWLEWIGKTLITIIFSCLSVAPVFSSETSSPSESAPVIAVRQQPGNGFFVDPDGREVLLRGINVNSLGEYWQYDPERPTVYEFGEADMDVIASLGFNLVRLIVTWSTVEPAPGQYDGYYLARVNDVIDKLWRRGIYTLVDLHQDAWGPTLAARDNEQCGEGTVPANGWDGAPGWATLVKDETLRCAPVEDGHPNRELSPAVREAWIAFLDNRAGPGGVGLQDRYTRMLEELVAAVSNHPGVMGYDIINEPNAIYDSKEYLGLEKLYKSAVSSIRRGEQRAGSAARIIVFEPSGIWANLTEGGTVRKFSDDSQLAYGPHIYQGSISRLPLDGSVIKKIHYEAASYGGVPVIIGEWGIHLAALADETDTYLRKMLIYQDREHWGAAIWQYQTACGDPHIVKNTPEDITGWGLRKLDCVANKVPTEWNTALTELIGRPALYYAAGTISQINWDSASREFSVSGSDEGQEKEAVLFIPGHYDDLKLETTGFDKVRESRIYGGRKWVAKSNGGSWRISLSP